MRLVSIFLMVFTLHASEGLPQVFEQLATPLYTSSKPINQLSSIEGLKPTIEAYCEELEKIKEMGHKIDATKDTELLKEYLRKLRKFQKRYKFILHKVHININKAIKDNDYEQFCKLTQYEFDGLLKSRALLQKSLIFYNANKSKKTIPFFEKKIHYDKMAAATTKEFFNVATESKFDSKTKSKNKKVQLEAVDVGKSIIIYVQNNNPYSVTVTLKPKYKNLDYDRSIKNTFSLKAGAKKEHIRLHKRRTALSYRYSYSYKWIIGSFNAVHNDSYIYSLPYTKGKKYRVSQGHNTNRTHKGHSKYAIDFAMKCGSRIHAARDGLVVKTKENSNKGGYAKKFASAGNYITIEHSDATLATYYHLRKNGVAVKVGQRVKKGEFIGYSGNTGYSSGPHLHFSVFKAKSASKTESIPVKFATKKGILHEPKKGTWHIAI